MTLGSSMPSPPQSSDSLLRAAVRILCTPDPFLKADYTDIAVKLWQSNQIQVPYSDDSDSDNTESDLVPDTPAHSELVRLVEPNEAPRLGRGGSLASRIALLHSLVHIESGAVDLSWDIIARFGARERLPRAFFDDFVQVAADEAKHFRLLEARLQELGSFYGALPGHSGLWKSARETSGDLLGRLAIEHCVHEARGLDVLPQTIERFRRGGDHVSADILEKVIYPEEITHCAAGVRWFRYLCRKNFAMGRASHSAMPTGRSRAALGAESEEVPVEEGGIERSRAALKAETTLEEDGRGGGGSSVAAESASGALLDKEEGLGDEDESYIVRKFHEAVRKHFRGRLKPPFNEGARSKAGFSKEWYLPLAT